VKTSDGELGNEVDVGVEAGEVGSQQDLGSNGDELSVRGGELLLEAGGGVEDEDGFVDLDPLSSSSLQVREESLVERKDLGEEANGLEAGLGFLRSLAEDKERDRAKDDGAGGNAKGLSLLEFLDGLVEVELEVGFLRELGDDEVVVGVKPKIKWVRVLLLDLNVLKRLPFFHLRRGNVDAICLATTAHGKVDIERRESKTLIALGDDIEGSRVVENVVVEGEFAAAWLSVSSCFRSTA
jgi:hypothetical protein